MLDKFTAETFTRHLNQTFRIHYGQGESFDAALSEVNKMGREPQEDDPLAKRRPFSIILHGPSTPILPQAIYTLEHEALGRLSLFLVPLGPAGDNMQYEALFT